MNENRALRTRNMWVMGTLVVLAVVLGLWYTRPAVDTISTSAEQSTDSKQRLSNSQQANPQRAETGQSAQAPVLVLGTLDAFEFDNEDEDIEAEVESEQAELAEQDARIKSLEQSYEESEL